MPLRLGKYPSGIGKDQRNELLRAVRNIGSDSAGVVPNTMQIEFIQAMQGKASDFLQAVEYWERKQSIAVLGGTLTSQADGKSLDQRAGPSARGGAARDFDARCAAAGADDYAATDAAEFACSTVFSSLSACRVLPLIPRRRWISKR